MKPITLTMKAFGAYATEQTIDFRRLEDNNLFLIYGPTGSGKTTILDGIVFALYGKSSGSFRSGKSLRSDFAPLDSPTEVEFTFRLGRRTLSITRSPEQEVKKQRGEGTTVRPADASLVEVMEDGTRVPLATKSEEVTRTIISLLGFNADQFTQIVLLPQGQFRQFLSSDSKDKKEILETIFHTAFFSRLENLLSAKSAALEKEYGKLREQEALLLEQHQCAKAEELAPRIEATGQEAAKAAEQLEKLKFLLDKSRKELAALETLQQHFREAAEAKKALAALTAREKDFENHRLRIRQGEEAISLAEPFNKAALLYTQLKNSQQALAEAEAELKRMDERLDGARKKMNTALAGLALLDPEEDENSGASAEDGMATGPDSDAHSPANPLETIRRKILRLETEAATLTGVNRELARMAAELVEGQPCPVCGSTSHPRPANISAEKEALLQREIAAKRKAAETLQQLDRELRTAQDLRNRAAGARETAAKQIPGLEKECQDAVKVYQDLLADSYFKGDSRAYQAARKEIPFLPSLRQEIQDFEKALAAAGDRLKRAEAAVEGQTPPDLTVPRETVAKLERDHQEAVRAVTLAEKTLAELKAAKKQLAALHEKLAEKATAYEDAAYLAQTAGRKNPLKLTLSAFVLQTILDDVLIAANERLQTMSRQRFLLNRSPPVLDARKQNGLDLEVNDAYTGLDRQVSTLSGGETFLASLSLALGLTDVVQSYAGGIRLDTILIDEGFGTLDPESLDAAMKALTDLQANGRLVGIISHVAELEERIPARLEIIPGENGSTARWHV